MLMMREPWFPHLDNRKDIPGGDDCGGSLVPGPEGIWC